LAFWTEESIRVTHDVEVLLCA